MYTRRVTGWLRSSHSDWYFSFSVFDLGARWGIVEPGWVKRCLTFPPLPMLCTLACCFDCSLPFSTPLGACGTRLGEASPLGEAHPSLLFSTLVAGLARAWLAPVQTPRPLLTRCTGCSCDSDFSYSCPWGKQTAARTCIHYTLGVLVSPCPCLSPWLLSCRRAGPVLACKSITHSIIY